MSRLSDSRPGRAMRPLPNGSRKPGAGKGPSVYRWRNRCLCSRKRTGSSLASAVRRRPTASMAREGITTTRPGYMGEYRDARLRVPDGPAGQVPADGYPQHHGAGPLAGRAPPDGGGFALYLLHGGPDVVEELHLGDRPQPSCSLADGPPDDIGFRQRRVVAPVAAELAL